MEWTHAFHELGLEFGASPAEIQKAYRAKAREHHPDLGGDVDSMRDLNEARDIALRHTSELSEQSSQDLVLQKILDLESRRDEREASQEKGRELVAATASFQIGRLRRLQRRASASAVVTASIAGALALLKVAGPASSPVLNLYVAVLAGVAIGFGLYRALLAERISQIQFAIEDAGAALMRRPAFASVFRDIGEGLLDADDFEEMELELAVKFWLQSDNPRGGIEWIEDEGDLVDGLADAPVPLSVRGPVVTLRDLARRGQAHGYVQLSVFETLTSLALHGDLLCYRSGKGICCEVTAILKLTGRDSDYFPANPWDEVVEAIELLSDRDAMALRYERKGNAWTFRLRKARFFLRSFMAGSHDDLSVRVRLRRLGQRIGVVDLTKLLIGKGLENRLLSDHESLDRYRELMTTYRFVIDEVKPSDGT